MTTQAEWAAKFAGCATWISLRTAAEIAGLSYSGLQLLIKSNRFPVPLQRMTRTQLHLASQRGRVYRLAVNRDAYVGWLTDRDAAANADLPATSAVLTPPTPPPT